MSTLFFTEEEQARYEREMREIHFVTSLGFLNAHNGLRRGNVHLVMGTAGGGKSTLIRTMIRDFLFKKENMKFTLGLALSEETVASYRAQISYGMPSHNVLMNTVAIAEPDMKVWNKKLFMEWIRMYQPDFLVFDNITTSRFYMDMSPRDQAAFAMELKQITAEVNCATLLVAHTDAHITDGIERLIHMNDIRGSKSIVNLVEFLYILQRFEIGSTFFPTIRTVKHRSQELVHSLYSLTYDPKIRQFSGDHPINFEKFKEIFNERNRLK